MKVEVNTKFVVAHDVEARIMMAKFEDVLGLTQGCWLKLKTDSPFLSTFVQVCECFFVFDCVVS